MENNETTALLVAAAKPKVSHTTVNLPEPDGSRSNSWFRRNLSFMEMEPQARWFVIATAMMAIVLFVIIVDMSITALKLPDPAYRQDLCP